MNTKLIDVSFPLTHSNHCCFGEYNKWVDTKTTKVGEGEDTEELFLGTVETGTVIHCPTCGANYILDDKGSFICVDPEEFDLVDTAEQPPLMVVGPIEYDKGPAVDAFGNTPAEIRI